MPGPNAGISYPPPPLETSDTEPAPPLDRNFTPPPDTLRAVRPPVCDCGSDVQIDWWVNGGFGNDKNDGRSPATSLRTFPELFRRIHALAPACHRVHARQAPIAGTFDCSKGHVILDGRTDSWAWPNEPEVDLTQCPNCNRVHR